METDLSKIALAEAMELGPEPAKFRHWWERIAVKWYFGPVLAVLLLVHTGLLGWSAVQHSPNANEPSHLAAGIHDWQSGRFVLFRGNPPLVRMVAAVPVLAVGAETDWSHYSESSRSRPEFQVGRDFIAANGQRSLWLTTLARLACIPFSLIGAVVCFLWARALYGLAAGFVSLTLWCLSPDILGHASCITPDAHATAIGLAGHFLFWRWLRQPTWGMAGAAGLVLGLTLLTKTTWILLLLLWPMIWLASRTIERQHGGRMSLVNEGLQLAALLVLGLHVLNMGYLYDGTFQRLGDYQFVSKSLTGYSDRLEGNRFSETLLGEMPVPLPEQYVLGADVQKATFEGNPLSYFRGRTYRHGFWYYYLYCLCIKVPLGTWLLAGTVLAMQVSRRERPCSRFDEFVLLAPFVFFLTIVSAETEYSAHFRYVMLILPYAFIWIGQVGTALTRRSLWTVPAASGLVWSVFSTLWFSPHWLSYFNEAAGGPSRGYEHLANSNIDWGQDLLYLRDWMAEHPVRGRLHLAYYGMFHPGAIGMEFEDVSALSNHPDTSTGAVERKGVSDTGPDPGWYAVSVNFVTGHPFCDYRSDGTTGWFEAGRFAWFRHLEPVDRAGYSILIYHVTRDDILRLNEELAKGDILPSKEKRR